MKTMNNNYEAPMAEMIELTAQAVLTASNDWGITPVISE